MAFEFRIEIGSSKNQVSGPVGPSKKTGSSPAPVPAPKATAPAAAGKALSPSAEAAKHLLKNTWSAVFSPVANLFADPCDLLHKGGAVIITCEAPAAKTPAEEIPKQGSIQDSGLNGLLKLGLGLLALNQDDPEVRAWGLNILEKGFQAFHSNQP